MDIILSPLPKTWILDLDGVLVKHNEYLHGNDVLLPHIKEFVTRIPPEDKIVILTARTSEYRKRTELFLYQNGIRFDYMLFDMPVGERILVNDKKSSGLLTSIAINLERDTGLNINVIIDEEL